ncbi:MAG: hypothetical protein Fues2KO_39850 [Fuerstiella sp.]
MKKRTIVSRPFRFFGKQSADRKGAAMVEMAVCFPIFMLMLLGVIEFGRALMVSQMLTNASREGCREAIIDGATKSSVESDVRQMVVDTVGCDGTDVAINVVVTSESSGAEIANLEDAEQRDLIQIDIMVPFNAISYSGGRFLNGSNLRGRCAMRKE